MGLMHQNSQGGRETVWVHRVNAMTSRGLLYKGLLVLVASWMLFGMPLSAATRTDLNGDWQFRADPDEHGEASGWQSTIPAGTESIHVPHTWNIGRLHDYRGVAWYFRRF